MENKFNSLNDYINDCHTASVNGGWYTNKDGTKKERNVPEMLCLIHSEVSEAMEGHRKNLQDDKLPHRSMVEVELVDVLIRIFDLAGYLNLDLDGAYHEKRAYNDKREDHKLENRFKENGKAY